MKKRPSSSRTRTVLTSGILLGLIAAFGSSSYLVLQANIPQVASRTWVSAGDVGAVPGGAASVALADGRLLVIGGTLNGVPSDRIASYDPAAGDWTLVGQLATARSNHAASLLKDGRVLVAGGTTVSGPAFDIEIYDPATGTSAHAGNLTLPRFDHATATLKDGRVLVAGGSDGVSPLAGAEIFDPETGQSAGIGAGLATARMRLTATTLLDGHVLVAGGTDGTNDLSSAEIFYPESTAFFPTGPMQVARSGHVAVLLPNNNQVLIAGGTSSGVAQTSAEVYADWRNGFAAAGAGMSAPRAGAIAGGLSAHSLALVAGGGATTGEYYGYATVKTDKDDYQPGEIVTITGSGWQPGETVTLKVSEDADTHFDWNLIAVADAQGNIVNQDFYPRQDEQFQHVGMRFYVLATGAASQALTTFTDGALKIKSAAWPGSSTPRTFGVTIQPFVGSTNCTTGGGAISSTTADSNGANTGNIGGGDSWQIVANVNANTPNASFTFSSWSNPHGLVISPNLTSRTICVQGFQSGTRDLIGNYVANAAPVANNDSYATNEDTALNVSAPGLLGNDTDANGNSLTAVRPAGSTGPGNGVLTVNADGSFTYTPHSNFNGTDTFTYKANDGSVDSAGFATVTITVNAVNDAPAFTKGPDQAVLEDAAAQTLAGWATGISAGPANESGQTLAFTTTNDNNALFAGQPHVALDGTLTFTPAANASGTASVTVRLSDDGGSDNGGIDFHEQTFTITVTPVNDVPGFAKGPDQTVLEDAAAQTVTNWATTISAGPNEGSQTVSFVVTANTNSPLFSVQPAVAADGTLTYTLASDANGSATITIVLKDDGGTQNGGIDTSDPQTFVINVTPVNDEPTFTKGPDPTVLEDAGPQTVPGWASNISAGPPDESGQTLTFSTTNDNNSLFSVQPSVAANGALTYTSAPDANGSATVTVRLSDNGGTANGGDDHSEQTFTITVTAVNDAPANVTANLSASAIDENQSTTVSGTFTDPDTGDLHTVTINWGDGAADTVINLAAGQFSYSAAHQYLDDDPTGTALDAYTITVTVTDSGTPQLSGMAGASITVGNVAPVISAVTGPTAPQPLGSSITVTGVFSDQGTKDTHTCAVAWDDGTTSAGNVTEANGAGTCTASRTYMGPGVYSIVMTITDDDTGSATRPMESEFVVIFDPSAGFVTGGGWIMSPAGASAAYPTATGKANFGFVSKYKKGSNTPEGQTEFQFKAGDLNFHSSAYDYGSLVVSGGKAQYRGTGTVNGVAGFRFVLTAYDGQGPGGNGYDRFRIKITTATGAVVYDNRLGASEDLDNADPMIISGGSIVIHR